MCMSFVYANPIYAVIASDSAMFYAWDTGEVDCQDEPEKRLVACPWGFVAPTGSNGAITEAASAALKNVDAGASMQDVGKAVNTAFMEHVERIRADWRAFGGKFWATASFSAIGLTAEGHWAARLATVGDPLGMFWPGDSTPFYGWATPNGVPDGAYAALKARMNQFAYNEFLSLPDAIRRIAGFFVDTRRAGGWMNERLLLAGYVRRGASTVPFGVINTTAEAAAEADSNEVVRWVFEQTANAA